MIYITKPKKIAIYINTYKKTASAIKAELGCDVLINGGLYDRGSFKPCCHLKKDGVVLASDQWSYWGYGWNTGADICMDSSVNIAKYRNYICCTTMLRNGKSEPMNYTAEQGGTRGRSAIGLKADNSVVLFCSRDYGTDRITPEALRTQMQSLGCVSAIMLDSGGSSQCIFPNGTISSSRKVHNYICLWESEPTEQPCPYSPPTRILSLFNRGDDVKWVQWMLNQHGGANLKVDGSFGSTTYVAMQKYAISKLKDDANVSRG